MNLSYAQCASSDVRIEVIAAPNLIDDSNVQTPAGVNVTAAHFGAKFENITDDTLVNVFAYIGDYSGGGNGTPGIYPSKTHTGLVGTFSFTHTAGASDATRFIDTLYPNQTKTVYWMVEYPNVDNNGKPVYNACSDETDDLKLDYDIWTSFADDEVPNTNCYTDTALTATIRCEITASANKIWPNGSNKVPSEWVTAVEAELGYKLGWADVQGRLPGVEYITVGTWYDMGNVNQGFDNNGDFIPDYNCWMQPVGNPDLFDPTCFRLIRTSGVLLVKSNSEGLITEAFEDQLYFENLTPSNTGVVGYVEYTYMPLIGGCSSTQTPYQEAASGRNNEKFNADYGKTITMSSIEPSVSLVKSVDSSFIDLPPSPHTLSYSIKAFNDSNVTIGSKQNGLPIVIREEIPQGTTYKSGTASNNSNGYSFKLFYSTDNGATWVNNEPNPASSVTDIQWWMNRDFEGYDSVEVTLDIEVLTSYLTTYGSFIDNWAYLSLGNGPDMEEAKVQTAIRGKSVLGDTVFSDNGSGSGIAGDGVQNGSEGPISGITVQLYFDVDSNGIIDDSDILYGTTTIDANGWYQFSKLPKGNYLAKVVKTDVTDDPSYPGYNLTTDEIYFVALDGNDSFLDADFGFAPALSITKTVESSNPAIESGNIEFNIEVSNVLKDPNFTDNSDIFWMSILDEGSTTWTGANNILGSSGPDGTYANDLWNNGASTFDPIYTSASFTKFQGDIVKVELIDELYLSSALSDDSVTFSAYVSGAEYGVTLGANSLNSFVGSSSSDTLVTDITSLKSSWTWNEILSVQRRVGGFKVGKYDDHHIYVDASGIRITTDASTVFGDDRLSINVPLTDSFDVSEFSFLGANPSPDSIDEAKGILFWRNIGPIEAGGTRNIEVNLKALEPSTNLDYFVNHAIIKNSSYLDGTDANVGSDADSVSIEQRGTISGKLWSDECNGSSGSYDASSDGLLINIRMALFGCVNSTTDEILYPAPNGSAECTSTSGGTSNNGKWLAMDTVITDEQGAYLFEGLEQGFYYIDVLTADLSNPTQSSDPDGTSDNRWGDPSANLNTFNELSNNEDEENIDFGYVVDPQVSGYVFEIVGNDTIPASGVQVSTSPGSFSSTSNSEGFYLLDGLSTSTNYTLSTTTPAGATWTQVYAPSTQNLCAGEIVKNRNFAFTRAGSSNIGDTIFYDYNGNGVEDPNEEGVVGVKIFLIRDVNGNGEYDPLTDIYVDTTITGSAGNYLFENLPANDWIVQMYESSIPHDSYSLTSDPDEVGKCKTCDAESSLATDGTANDLTLDFGIQLLGSGTIGEVVWIDSDNDLLKSSNEQGLDSVFVYLYADLNGDQNFVLVDSMRTNSDGEYLFEDLPNTDYKVLIEESDSEIPSNLVYTQTLEYSMTISGDSTHNTTKGCTNCPLSANFPFNGFGSIGDFVYWDANENGTQDLNELGIANVTVYLIDSVGTKIDSMVTADGTGSNPIGYYRFESLSPAQYSIQVKALDPDLKGAAQTADPNSDGLACTDPDLANFGYPACDNIYAVELAYGEDISDADFGYNPPGKFGDYVWIDLDSNQVQNPGEPPLADVAVYLCSSSSPCSPSSGDFIDSVLTDNDGYYYFSDLGDGSYSVTVNPPDNYVMTTFGGDSSVVVVLSSGSVTSIDGNSCSSCDFNVDFGMKQVGANAIAGNICLDDIALDGVCDGTSGETDLDSISVYLYQSNGAGFDQVGELKTSSDGSYAFTGLPDGNYVVSMDKSSPLVKVSDLTTSNSSSPSGDLVEAPNSIYHKSISLSGDTTLNDFDFAFDLSDLDFGDLPSNYAVSLSQNGAYHIINNNWKLGSNIDAESDGLPSVEADGDDNDNFDDDDGIEFLNQGNWEESTNQCIVVTYDIPTDETAYVVGWIDWDDDGTFVNDMVLNGSVSAGNSPDTFCFNVPSSVNLEAGWTNSRFRLFAEEPDVPAFSFNGLPSGDSLIGEVEDYSLKLLKNTIVRDFGDLPEGYGDAWHDYLDTNNDNVPDQLNAVWAGQIVSNEGDSRHSNIAVKDLIGDDALLIPSSLDTSQGQTDTLQVIVNANQSNKTVYFKLWIDWNNDEQFDSIYTGFGISGSPDTVDVVIDVPNTYLGAMYARLRVSDNLDSIANPTGGSTNGEVEDYYETPTPLPVSWVSFDAELTDNDNVLLTWTTAFEYNNEGFEIQRSEAQTLKFKSIGFVKGIGFSNVRNNYEFIDNTLGSNDFAMIYRLKQIDFDNKESFSEMRLVNRIIEDQIVLFPNPSSKHINIDLGTSVRSTQITNFEVLDLMEKHIFFANPEKDKSIDVSSLAAGTYVLRIELNEYQTIEKLFIKSK